MMRDGIECLFSIMTATKITGAPIRSSAALARKNKRLSQAKVFSIQWLEQATNRLAPPTSSNQALVDGTSSGAQQFYQVSDSSVGISFLTADSLPTDCIAWQCPPRPSNMADSSEGYVYFLGIQTSQNRPLMTLAKLF
jgi:hypothetical protein